MGKGGGVTARLHAGARRGDSELGRIGAVADRDEVAVKGLRVGETGLFQDGHGVAEAFHAHHGSIDELGAGEDAVLLGG
jgi:hypothetical protein